MMNVYLQEEDAQTAAPAEGGESTDMGGSDMGAPATETPAEGGSDMGATPTEGGEATPGEGQTM